ncbi:MAG: hypothetical protein NT141_01380 [candidate division WWE3 bacterium]|nr:hypothetical protein [candidate division WWE3 bacterium]
MTAILANEAVVKSLKGAHSKQNVTAVITLKRGCSCGAFTLVKLSDEGHIKTDPGTTARIINATINGVGCCNEVFKVTVIAKTGKDFPERLWVNVVDWTDQFEID